MGTLVILTLFEIELVSLLVALQDLFFRSWPFILDLAVISFSLGIQSYILFVRHPQDNLIRILAHEMNTFGSLRTR